MDKSFEQMSFIEEEKTAALSQAEQDLEKYGLHEPEFNVVNLDGDTGDKTAMLKKAKEDAIGMVKTASFDGRFQDPYPSPFLNLSDTQIPRTTTEIFRWCKYFYMFDPLISGAINALATFPITEVYLEEENRDSDGGESDLLKLYKKVIFKNLNMHKLLIEIGIDYYLYGNCFIFGEMWENPDTKEVEWKNMIRLDPSKMIIDFNPVTQEKKYKWTVPVKLAEIVKKKKPLDEYNKIPDIIKKAVKKNQAIVLNSNNVYHFSRATDSMGDNSIWGTPIIANVLKLLMYRNILRQAQEAIAREHIVPFRIFYLQKMDNYDPNVDFNKVAVDFAQQINKSVRDPNHKVVSPIPVNCLNIGGEGKSLMLTPEIEQVQSEILAGMNMPREFIFGGVSYSGSSISLKILENQFITYRLLLKDFLQNFVIKNMARARREWVSEKDDDSLLSVKMQDLKMQDDVQQKQLVIQLNSSGKVTDEYMWKTIGVDPDKMREGLEQEALVTVQNKTQVQMREIQMNTEVQKAQIESQLQLQVYQTRLQSQYKQAYPDVFAEPQQPMTDQNGNPVEGGDQQMQPEQQAQMQAQQQAQAEQQQAEQEQAQAGQQKPQQQGNKSQIKDKAQPTVGQPKQEENKSVDQDKDVKDVALKLIKLPEDVRNKFLGTLPQSKAKEIQQAVSELDHNKKLEEKAQIDMRPMPDKKPPRRDSLK